MGKAVGLANRGGGSAAMKVVLTALDGSATIDYMADFPRVTQNTNTDNYHELEGPYVHQHRDNLYCLFAKEAEKVTVGRLERGAIRLNISADPASTLPTKGEIVTQGGVTATVLHDYKAGDLYISVTGKSGGDFTAGAITFTTADGATVTTQEDNGGEWEAVFETAEAMVTTTITGNTGAASCSGIGYGIKDNKPTIGFIYIDADKDIHSVIMDPSDLTWDDIDSLEQFPSSYYYRDCGSVMNGNTLVWLLQGHTSLSRVWAAELNLGTGVLSFGEAPAHSNGIRASSPVLWNGEVYVCFMQTSNRYYLYNVSGGGFVLVDHNTVNTNWDPLSPPIMFVGPDDNALYCVVRNSLSQMIVHRYYKATTGTVYKTCPNDVPTTLITDVGEALLPAAIRTVQSSGVNARTFLDVDGNTSLAKLHIWYAFSKGLAPRRELGYTPFVDIDSGNKPTFAGTIGQANDVTFQNNIEGELPDGSWITINEGVHKGGQYRVVSTSGATAQLANHGDTKASGTFERQGVPPVGTLAVKKVQLMSTESGDVSDLSGVATPHARVGGGYIYTDGGIDAEIQTVVGVAGGIEITFDIFDPDGLSAGADIEARGFYMKEDGSQGQMTLRSVGQNVKNGNVNEQLSAGNGKTFVWDSLESDGVANGLTVAKSVDVVKV